MNIGIAIFYGLTALGIVAMWIASVVLQSWMLCLVAILMSAVWLFGEV